MKELTARPQPVCDVLDFTIEDYITKKFGETVYSEMLADVIDYSQYANWTDSTDYILDDIVIYDGIPYILTVAENSTSDSPNCSDEWEVAQKFNDECYNKTFTEGGMTKLLSWVVFVAAIGFYPEVLQANGFSGDDKDYKEKSNYYKSQIYAGIARMEKMFERWNTLNGCLTISGCDTGTAQTKSNRQIAW